MVQRALSCLAAAMAGQSYPSKSKTLSAASNHVAFPAFLPREENLLYEHEVLYVAKDCDTVCTICTDDLGGSAGINVKWVSLTCPGLHVFHADCLGLWGGHASTCPNCRSECRLRTRSAMLAANGPFQDPVHHFPGAVLQEGHPFCAICSNQHVRDVATEHLCDVPWIVVDACQHAFHAQCFHYWSLNRFLCPLCLKDATPRKALP